MNFEWSRIPNNPGCVAPTETGFVAVPVALGVGAHGNAYNSDYPLWRKIVSRNWPGDSRFVGAPEEDFHVDGRADRSASFC